MQFLLNIVKSGNYRFFINIEALTAGSSGTLKPGGARKQSARPQVGKSAGRN